MLCLSFANRLLIYGFCRVPSTIRLDIQTTQIFTTFYNAANFDIIDCIRDKLNLADYKFKARSNVSSTFSLM